MASNAPPLLIDIILSGPEVVAAERALAGALERSGFPVAEGDPAADPAALDVLPTVYRRWKQQTDRLNSSACALGVDGHGLLVVSVPVLDVPVVIMALKSRLFDLIVESRITGIDGDDNETEMIIDLIGRLEARR